MGATPVRADQANWITRKEAAERLSTYPDQISRLARRGLIRVLRVPGMHPKFSAADIERLSETAGQR